MPPTVVILRISALDCETKPFAMPRWGLKWPVYLECFRIRESAEEGGGPCCWYSPCCHKDEDLESFDSEEEDDNILHRALPTLTNARQSMKEP